MSQVINTNLSSLTAQRNLGISSDGYSTCLERLSSGLRINSAKDDAAGFAIATRMESTISGSMVAKRNSNDAISLAQIAEGALQETTNMLLRMRELAVQSANGTNAAQDRAALHAEVNQLLAQLSMSADDTNFNGLNLLDGTLSAASFQVGAEQYQSVTISIANTDPNQIGLNSLSSTEPDGIQQANYGIYMEANVMAAPNAAATNGLLATNFIFDVQTSVASVVTTLPTVTTLANASASYTANQINADVNVNNYVKASAYTDILISNFTYGAGTSSITMRIKDSTGGAGGAVTSMVVNANSTPAELALQINSTPAIAALGVYAMNGASGVRIISPDGHDINFNIGANSANAAYNVTQFDNAGAPLANINAVAVAGGVGAVNSTVHGILSLETYQNVSLQTTKDSASQFFDANQATYRAGFVDTIANNRMQGQTITIAGNNGSTDIVLAANSSARTIATAINQQSGLTNVSAKATTALNIRNINTTGTVSFNLYGNNSTPVQINASVTPTDYNELVTTINSFSGTTGINAQVDTSSALYAIRLHNSNGNDIRISDFNHSAGIAPKDVTTTMLSNDGSTLLTPTVVSMEVLGNPDTNASGNPVKLYAGGGRNPYNTTVVGGNVLLNSNTSFSVTSNVDGTVYSGSLFNVAATTATGSSFSAIANINISTANGAIAALPVIDQAIDQISKIRADLGAIQSRFESVIRNISYNVDNVTAAKSRVMDTDFAWETSQLARTQMLTQAGLSMVAQANAIPQAILSLLQ